MKKLLTLALCLSLVCLFGCSSAPASIDLTKTMQSLRDSVKWDDELILAKEEIFTQRYKPGDVKLLEYQVYVSGTSATANELAILHVDAASKAAAKELLEKRAAELLALYADYRPDQVFRIQNKVISEKGDYLLLAISPDSAAVEKAFLAAFK